MVVDSSSCVLRRSINVQEYSLRWRTLSATVKLKRLQHSVWTLRSSIPTESTGKHRSVATAIGTENSGALAMDCSPYLLAEHPYPDLNL